METHIIPARTSATTCLGSRGAAPWPAAAWRQELREAITDPSALLQALGLREGETDAVRDAQFPLRVPRSFVRRMTPGDPADPLLRQVLPQRQEALAAPGFVSDPLREADAEVAPGVLRKYAGRALLLATGTCAVNCRYCFRRHYSHPSAPPELAPVREDASVREVILSGGDPLLLTDAHLTRLVQDIDAIGHVATLRIHTRLPVVIPQRATAALVDALTNTRLRVVVVMHVNHGNEIDAEFARAMAVLKGLTLLNQSVLLRGVNDDAQTLAELSERLFAAGVLPYYLHMPDAVAGTAHFHVSEARAVALHRALAARLPGYLVPRLARETPGAAAKELVGATARPWTS